jgi:hypothetical protein
VGNEKQVKWAVLVQRVLRPGRAGPMYTCSRGKATPDHHRRTNSLLSGPISELTVGLQNSQILR